MQRLLATMRCDATLQLRNGFYAATAFVTVIWALILMQAGAFDLRWLIPPMVVGNLLIGTFSFMGGMVLLEKGEGTLAAQVVTPLRIGEYLAAKIITLTALALAETLVVVLVIIGWRFNPLLLLAGVILAAAIYCLAGFITVVRYTAINEYLLPSGAYIGVLWLPLLAQMAQWRPWVLYLHPMSAPLALIEAAVEPAAPWLVPYGLAYSALWIGLLYLWSRRSFRCWIVERGAGAPS
jgi:fluoroquinolone transport system permease protein